MFIRGTRITVQTVLKFLAAGDSVEGVREEYPKLTRADVQACLDYASRVSRLPGGDRLPLFADLSGIFER